MSDTARQPRHSRRQRLAGRLFDEHGAGLSTLAGALTVTADRADRLVTDAILSHVRATSPWRPSETTLADLAEALHLLWTSTHGLRTCRDDAPATDRSRLHALSDTELTLVALCLFGGCSYLVAARTLDLTPEEAARALRGALLGIA